MLSVLFGKSINVKRKKVLVVTEYIGETHNSTAYYWAQIVKCLQKTFEVTLVAPETKYVKEFSEKYCVSTKYVKFVAHDKNGLFSRLLGQLRQTSHFLRAIYPRVQGVDLVLSGTNPIFTMFFMACFKYLKPFKWLVLVHDIFPNNLIPAKILESSSFLYRVLTSWSRKVYSSPDNMICIGRDMQVLLREKTGIDNISIVPNWASTDIVKPQCKKDNEIISELGWEDNIVFQFFGNMGRLQGLPNLLKAIELTKHPGSRFLFIGSGSESNCVKEFSRSLNDSRGYDIFHYYGVLSLEKNNVGLNACDIALVTLSSDMFGLGVPSKAYFSMAADKPILYVGDKGSELELLIAEHNVGWYCEGDNPKKLAKMLDKIAEQFMKKTKQVEVNPRVILEENFSENMALEAISKVVMGGIQS